MSEKRFVLEISSFSDNHMKFLNILDNGKRLKSEDIVDLLNEQQATIQSLQGDVNRLQYIIDELRKDNYKRFEKINELKAKLKEKEEDEQLYANEILELREANKEFIQFKELGGDY